MSTYYGDDGRSPEEPRDGEPTLLVGRGGLASVRMRRSDASFVTDQLRRRIRRITWLDELGPEQAHEMWRSCRMLYELSLAGGDVLALSNLSLEDADIILEFQDHWGVDGLKRALREALPSMRGSGPVGPVEADRMAKELVDMMAS
jgi:hypothetical protein